MNIIFHADLAEELCFLEASKYSYIFINVIH